MVNIVVPVLGKGKRFSEVGYTTYKAYLPVGNQTMIEAVVNNVTPKQEHVFHILDRETYSDETEGAACSVLLARDLIDNDDPLIIANSDQLVDIDIDDFLAEAENWDACIMSFKADDPKYSYAVTDDFGGSLVSYTVEKPEKAIGEATVGIYYWKRGSDFVASATRMVEDNVRFNNEFYVCPTFNWMPRHLRIGTYQIEEKQMHCLGTPKDYEFYINNVLKEA